METNERGGKANKIKGRYDLIPGEALERVAVVLEDNLESHGEDNWRLIDRQEQLNHAIAHIYEYLHGNGAYHLTHALCRLLFACSTLEEDKDGSVRQEIYNAYVPE